MRTFVVRFSALLVGSVGLALTGGSVILNAMAQTTPACNPPAAGEYLLLVVNASANTTAQLEQTLPPTTTKTVCDYLGYQVTRVGGFTDSQVASSWAQYLTTNNNLQAFVARSAEGGPAETLPATTAQAPTTPAPAPAITAPPPPGFPTPSALPSAPAATPSASPAPAAPTTAPSPGAIAPAARGYNPQPLGNGYAVLVDYSSRPQVARDVQQLLTRPIGLVSYNQRPYLLAIHTTDAATASAVLQTLVERSYSAVMVDSRGAVLLTGSVAAVN
jgi:hypothetical protein